MPRAGDRGPTDTGVLLHEKLPVPKMRESEPKLRRRSSGSGSSGKLAAVFGVALLAGAMIGFLVRPMLKRDPRIGPLEGELAAAQQQAADASTRAQARGKELDAATSAKHALEQKLAEAQKSVTALAEQAQDEKAKAKEVQLAGAKMRAVVDRNAGVVSASGDDIRIRLADGVMFKPLDDELTVRGRRVLDRISMALKELPDRQIWVHGHTDDQPIAILTTPKPPKPKRGQKAGDGVEKPKPKFATNWELAAARSLAVVHYLQDVAKVDPSRLAALAFGQYQPISKNRALNRRLELVLSPRPKK